MDLFSKQVEEQEFHHAFFCLVPAPSHPSPADLVAMHQVIASFDFTAHLTLSTLGFVCVDEASSRVGVHRDPPCPLPALLCGSTVYSLTASGWVAHAGGGSLFMADGLWCLVGVWPV